MSTREPPRDEPRVDDLIDDLVTDLEPVRRVWSPAVHLAVWLAVELLVFSLVTSLGLRMDILGQLSSPLFLAEMTLLIATGGLCAAMALLAAVPGREPSRGAIALAVGLLVVSIACFYQEVPAGARSLASAPLGVGCAVETVTIALVPWAALLLLSRRGAPLIPVLSGGLAGAAAFLLAAATMRVVCPVDAFWHVVIWHLSPVAVGLSASSLLGILLLNAWRDDA